jgi:hypothetical protein
MGFNLEYYGMTFEKLSDLMNQWGYEIDPRQYFQFRYYTMEMLNRNRVMVLWNGPLIEAVIIYYLTDDFNKIFKKPMWKVVEDDPAGHQIYIDKMVCRKWNRHVREAVSRALKERFPNVKELVYHRAPKDRCVRIKRRETHELQSTVR